ncbi:MAG: cation transporter [Acidobacteria bacterium]|nr:cation transporter [Acidobacteriota bacterium]
MPGEQREQRSRIRIALLSIAAGSAILGLKFFAFRISGSTALLSDAYESVVNVVAAVFALGAVVFSGKPADREHPYGHGKIEHFSAVFEGGLISLAAVIIVYEAIHALMTGPRLQNLGLGVAINFLAGLLNGLLGAFLVAMGRRKKSKALEADGHHVLSDFYTTLGIGAGLLLVKFTGLAWLDPAIALAVGVLLAFTGFRLVRESSAALLDQEDPETLEKILAVMNRVRPPDILALHEMRTFRSGRYTHVDIHIVLPEVYPIRQAHDLAEDFGRRALATAGVEGELHTHVDPCAQLFCPRCPLTDCPIRKEAWRQAEPFTLEEALSQGAA